MTLGRRFGPRRDDRPPPWWPQGEPWPPRGRGFQAQRRRERFVRRSGWYAFWPIWVIFWLIASGRWSLLRASPLDGGVVLILACAAAAGTVAAIIRWIAAPVADIVSASDRIARRDYRVRINEPEFGPSWVRDTARAFIEEAPRRDGTQRADVLCIT